MKFNAAPIRWLLFAIIGVAVAAISGRLAMHMVNDTPSYVDYPLGSLTDALLSIRTPGYPVFLAVVSATVGLSWVPLLQVLLHATASWSFTEALHRRGMPLRSAGAAGGCILVGCTAADHISTISTDAPAASLGVITASLLMNACRTRSATQTVACAIACAVVAIITIFVRPAYLFLVPWIAVTGWLLFDRGAVVTADADADDGADATVAPSRLLGLKIACAVGIVVVGWMFIRKLVVSDFAIAPFGHQNLSAVLVQTVPAETLRNLPGESAELGRRVADELTRRGFQLPDPSGGSLPTLTIEQQWGQINYGIVWPLAREVDAKKDASNPLAPEVRVHRQIGTLNRAILSQSPTGYLRWLLLAVRRSVWGTAANIAMHPIFLPTVLLGLLWLLVKVVRQPAIGPIELPAGWNAFAIVAITYAVFSIGFVILTSPPLGRFADAGAIFLPGLVASVVVANLAAARGS
ncbi:hypothetical protein Mal15_40050 [Stieleria maiorica]|uniref:Glycosyltransferase RgtA/B/C/D-like domain-containing protein n=1 Tax=Stieleria maiorica TaxID=2795974 RepID=A0A5B9MFL7_9BACT|nr:hypothetical protein [Stieleria maiorica]QEF99938.1 hypothetical protein Mal15_40050 [Stieleria maiorica]